MEGHEGAERRPEMAVARARPAQAVRIGVSDQLAPPTAVGGGEQAHLEMPCAPGAVAARLPAAGVDLRHGAHYELLLPQHVSQEGGLPLLKDVDGGEEHGPRLARHGGIIREV